MEAVAKCSNLVLPKGFVELDREEMTYVDGGVYISYAQINSVVEFFKVRGVMGQIFKSVGTLATCLGGFSNTIGYLVATIPVWGWIAAGVILGSTAFLSVLLASAWFQHKGLDIGVSGSWFTLRPYFNIK